MAAVVQAKMRRPALGWRRGAVGRLWPRRIPGMGVRDESKNHAWGPSSGGEWRAVGPGVDNTAVVTMVRGSLGVMPRRLLKTESGAS